MSGPSPVQNNPFTTAAAVSSSDTPVASVTRKNQAGGAATSPWIREDGSRPRRALWTDIFNTQNSKTSYLPDDASREITLE